MVKCIPLYPFPALLVCYRNSNNEIVKLIAISDLHLGFEQNLIEKGIYFNIDQAIDITINEISTMSKKSNADGVVILGDLNDRILNNSHEGLKRIKHFFERLSEIGDTYFIPGNHDGSINGIVPLYVNQITSTGMIIDDVLFTHGHAIPKSKSPVNKIIIGHIHPLFLAKNSILNGQRIWIYLKTAKDVVFADKRGELDVLIMPSFNNFLISNKRNKNKKTSTILNKIMNLNKIYDCKIMTLNGEIIGNDALLYDAF